MHKSQGSEFDHLALILPALSIDPIIDNSSTVNMQNFMSREMLYTALTRSKKSVLILGEKNILEKAVLNKENRYSGLGTLIKKNFHN